MYSVIETTNSSNGEREVCTVLTSWIENDTVFWPENYYKAIKKNLQKDSQWKKHKCLLLKSGIESFALAKKQEKFFEMHSHDETENESYTKNKKYFESSDFNEAFTQTQTKTKISNEPTTPPPLVSFNQNCFENQGNDTNMIENCEIAPADMNKTMVDRKYKITSYNYP